ncbi:MAG: hypothetical protein AABZ60_24835 [Planctomycetota bacterium]
MSQLKYSCPCGKRILAPTSHLHQIKPCPRCHQPVKIPGFGDPSFLLFVCECEESLSSYRSHCPKCQKTLPENLKPESSPISQTEPKKEEPTEPKKEELASQNQKSPEGFRLGIKMKIHCLCGKRMMVWTRTIGKEEICPKCQHTLRIPPSTASNVLHFVCDCGTYVSVREDICVSCQKDLKEVLPTSPETVPIKKDRDSPVPSVNLSEREASAKEKESPVDSDITDLSGMVPVDSKEEKK